MLRRPISQKGSFAAGCRFDGRLLWHPSQSRDFSPKWRGEAECGSNRWLVFRRPANFQHTFQGITPKTRRTSFSTCEEARASEYVAWAKGGGWVHKFAHVDSTAVVEVGAVVHEGAQVGPHSRISSSSVLGPRVTIGSHTTLWYNSSVQNCSIGHHCIIHNGVCIGQDGFGFFVDGEGKMVKKPQLLFVKIGDNIEIGANTCIDRGRYMDDASFSTFICLNWRDTVIGNHTKIDNQVQIGHNVVIGHSCIICGQVGIGGSCTLGDYVVLGGKAGVAEHVCIASKIRVAAKSGVISNISEAGDYGGFPAVPAKEWRKSTVRVRRLGQFSAGVLRDGV